MKFCKYCGTRLEEGQVCNCEKAVSERSRATSSVINESNINQASVMPSSVNANQTSVSPSNVPVNQVNSAGNLDFNQLLNRVINVIKHPIASLQDIMNDGAFNSSLILSGVSILIITLLSLLVVKQFSSMIMGLMGFGSLTSGDMNSLLMGSGYGNLEIPYVKIFFGELLALIIILFAIGGLSYLVYDKFFKIHISFKQIMNVLANTMVLVVIGFVISMIVMYLDTSLFIILLSVFMTAITLYFFKGLEVISKVTNDKMFYAIVTVLLIYNFAILYLLPKILY